MWLNNKAKNNEQHAEVGRQDQQFAAPTDLHAQRAILQHQTRQHGDKTNPPRNVDDGRIGNRLTQDVVDDPEQLGDGQRRHPRAKGQPHAARGYARLKHPTGLQRQDRSQQGAGREQDVRHDEQHLGSAGLPEIQHDDTPPASR